MRLTPYLDHFAREAMPMSKAIRKSPTGKPPMALPNPLSIHSCRYATGRRER
jgi:hypothetical protein